MSDMSGELVEEYLRKGDIEKAVAVRSGEIRNPDDYLSLRAILSCLQEAENRWLKVMCTDINTEDGLRKYYNEIKLLMRRVEFWPKDESVRKFVQKMEKEYISPYAIFDIIHVNYVDENKMKERLSEAMTKYCEDVTYRDSFRKHAERVVFYDIDI